MWDERYGAPGFFYGTAPNDFLVANAARFLPGGALTNSPPVGPWTDSGGAILSVGEGEGRNAVYLASLGFRVTGVDGSAVGLAKAQALAAERGVEIDTVVADLATFDLGVACWDGVVSLWCHTPPPVRSRLHRAIVEALKPGGVLLLEAYTPAQLGRGTGGPPTIELLLSLDAARASLAGLEFVFAEELLREVHEGHHDGMSAVVQVIARKP